MSVLLFSYLIGVLFAVFILWLSFQIQKHLSFLHDPVYVPSTYQKIEKMIEIAKLKKGEQVVDFGSGDGRLVIACAQKGCTAIGYEIHPILVWFSRHRIRQLKLTKKATIKWQSFWNADLHKADVVMLYGASSIMPKLEQKLRTELQPGARVITQLFTFPQWKPKKKVGDIYLYIV